MDPRLPLSGFGDKQGNADVFFSRPMVDGGRRAATGGGIEVASVIELSEASGRVAAGLFMTEG